MVVVVPFDGSVLSKSALLHAVRSSELYAETTLAVTVVPHGNAKYAREKGWLSSTEEFDTETVVSRLRAQVAEIAPDAEFEYVQVGRSASAGTISGRVRRFVRSRDTSAIFIGSENAGHSIIGTTSVGSRVAFEDTYDIAIIRNPLPDILNAERNDLSELPDRP